MPDTSAADQDVIDLITFLGDSRVEVKQMAVGVVEGLAGGQEGIEMLTPSAATLLPALLRLMTAPGALSKAALTALINLSQDERLRSELQRLGTVGRCADCLREGGSHQPGLLIKLLCNLTVEEAGAAELLQLGKGDLEGFNIAVLLSKFVEGPSEESLDYVAPILTNITRQRAGRTLLLDPSRGFLRALASQLRSGGVMRRRGCAAALRNVFFGAQREGDETMPQIAEQREVLTCMLDPLCGTSGEKDADDTVRENLAEALLLLAQSEVGRKALWDADAVEQMRKGYELEETPSVCIALEKCAEIFIHGGNQGGGDQDASEDDEDESVGGNQKLDLPPGPIRWRPLVQHPM